MRFEMRRLWRALGEREHGADFAGGPARDIQERNQFGGGTAFKALAMLLETESAARRI